MGADDAAGASSPGTAELPAAVRRLWGRWDPPRRGPKPALTLGQITEVAIRIADEEGLAAVSMARIAESLGFSSMALYRYVDSKDEIFALMAEGAVGAPPASFAQAGDPDWRAGMERWAWAQVEALVARPWYLELPVTVVAPGPNRLRWLDRGLALLDGTALGLADRIAVVGLVALHVLGEARLRVETLRAAADPYAGFDALLLTLADPVEHPTLYRLVREAGENAEPEPDDADLGIPAVLDGVAAFIERRTADRTPPVALAPGPSSTRPGTQTQ